MHSFRYLGNTLYCEGVNLESLVKRFGTPLYVYSQRTLTDHFQKLDAAMRGVDHLHLLFRQVQLQPVGAARAGRISAAASTS